MSDVIAYRMADVTQAVLAIQNAGLTIGRLEIDLTTGRVQIWPDTDERPELRTNDFDEEFG